MRHGEHEITAVLPGRSLPTCYRADLDALPLRLQNAYVLKLGRLLQHNPSVTLLSPEPSRGLPEGQAHTQRRVVWRWLVA